MLTKEQFNILSVFKKDLFIEMTFKQIKEQSRQKSNNVVQIALKEFQKQRLVKVKKTGNVNSYSLDLGNNLTLSYLDMINEIEISKKNFPKQILDYIQGRIVRYTPFFVLMIFGSYAKGKITEKSDLDIAVIVPSEKIKKDIIPLIE